MSAVCGSKGTATKTWTGLKDSAKTRMDAIGSTCTLAGALCSDISGGDSDDSSSSSDSSSASTTVETVCCINAHMSMIGMGIVFDTCSAEMKTYLDKATTAEKDTADAAWKVEYNASKAAWDAAGCEAISGMSFSAAASDNGYKDSLTAMVGAGA